MYNAPGVYKHVADGGRMFEKFHAYLQKNDIDRVECTAFHDTLGWEPALILTSSIYHSPFAYLF